MNSLLFDELSQELFVGSGQVFLLVHLDAGGLQHGHALRVLEPEGRVQKLERLGRELGVHCLDLLGKIVSQTLQNRQKKVRNSDVGNGKPRPSLREVKTSRMVYTLLYTGNSLGNFFNKQVFQATNISALIRVGGVGFPWTFQKRI